jgi:glutamate-ammonia-ligase adenylyltransferase
MEEELAKETARHFDYKTGRGGVLDVECAVQYLQLLHGSEHTEILEPAPIDSQRIKLAELGLINADCARILKDGWSFLQELGSRLRIVENRSISSLDVDRGDLDTLARHLGYNDDGEGTTSRALQKDYGEVTESIRSVYLEVMGI